MFFFIDFHRHLQFLQSKVYVVAPCLKALKMQHPKMAPNNVSVCLVYNNRPYKQKIKQITQTLVSVNEVRSI